MVTGDTAWVLTASALVLLMTPGLAFFYGGLVRKKNIVSTLMYSFVSIGIVGVLGRGIKPTANGEHLLNQHLLKNVRSFAGPQIIYWKAAFVEQILNN